MSMLVPPDLAAAGTSTDGVAHGFEGTRKPELSHIQAVLDRLSPEPTTARNLRWSSVFRISHRIVDNYGTPDGSGRAFVAGDAAHIHPPTGAQGMNTGIQDAHNLAWKLDFVLRGWAADDLLDTYAAERRPVGAQNAVRSETPTSPDLDALAIDIGITYQSGALADDGCPDGPAEDSWRPTGRPGARLPHLWLTRDGEQVSTLDLLGPGITVFTGPDGRCWRRAADLVSAELGVSVAVRVVGGAVLHDPAREFTTLYGLAADGAVVVRPDGHIAWRSQSADGLDLAQALRLGIRASLGASSSAVSDERGVA